MDDKTAATTELTSGQYGIVVYNDDGQAEVVYVTDTYKMEVDVDAGDDDNANNDRITSTTVDGVKTASAGDYTTIAKAVANATTLPLSAEQAKNATVTITVDDSVTAHASGIFTTAAVAENGTDSDLTVSYTHLVMKVEKIGYGMGNKDFEAANCVRALLGETAGGGDEVAELCCNLDDMTAEALGFAQEELLAAGALDV